LDRISRRLEIPVVDVVRRIYLESFIEHLCDIL